MRQILWPRRNEPFPGRLIFPLLFAAVYLAHIWLLRLPYFWDEAGYYIPAAWDFFRTGSLIPFSTPTNAHPPLPSLYLALWWKMGGYSPAVTREAMCAVAALALTAVTRLSLRLNPVPAVAAWTVTLTALYPVWFAQSTLAHADLLAAACTLWALVDAIPEPLPGHEGRIWRTAFWFSLAVLAKETAVVVPAALAAWEMLAATRSQPAKHLTRVGIYSICLLPLVGWYAYHYAKTGFVFGNPEFLRYNATATLSLPRFLSAVYRRLWHLLCNMNMYIPVLCALGAMFLRPLAVENDAPGEPGSARLRPHIRREAQGKIYWLLSANVLAFSVLGGALLTRYLLPAFPLVILLCVTVWQRRVLWWHALSLFTAAAFLLATFHNPPYGFAPEDNLAYRDMVLLHQQATARLLKLDPQGTVLTAWPMSAALTQPYLGYLRPDQQPIRNIVGVDDFSPEQIARVAAGPQQFTSAVIFSTKLDFGHPLGLVLPGTDETEEKYFGMHHDLRPEAVARLLGGRVAWQAERNGQWAGILLFPPREGGAVVAEMNPALHSYNR